MMSDIFYPFPGFMLFPWEQNVSFRFSFFFFIEVVFLACFAFSFESYVPTTLFLGSITGLLSALVLTSPFLLS